MATAKIALIGGTGLEDPSFLADRRDLPGSIDTPYGKSSDVIATGKLNGIDVVMMARHGSNHKTMPSNVNYRANIYALVNVLGCDAVLTAHAVGSLRPDLHSVGDLVAVDGFLDFTAHGGERGAQTFYDGGEGHLKGVCHVPMAEPFSAPVRQALLTAGRNEGVVIHDGGVAVVCEGPRFSSKAESKMYQMMGGHVIGMTLVPEVVLAAELGVPFASICIITDLDNEEIDHSHNVTSASDTPSASPTKTVSHQLVLENMKIFGKRAAKTFASAMPEIAKLVHDGRLKNPPAVYA